MDQDNTTKEPQKDTYVNGRRAVMQCLDSVLAKEKNIHAFEELFQSLIDGDLPSRENAEQLTVRYGFFKSVVQPMMPKDVVDGNKEDKPSELVITFKPREDKDAKPD